MTALLLAAALAAGPDLASHDGSLVQSAAVQQTGAGQVGMQGSGSTAAGVLGVFGLWSVGAGFAGQVGVSNEGGKVTPTVGVRYQILGQERFGVDLTAAARFKSVGFRATGSEVEFIGSLGHTTGNLSLTLNGVVGKGIEGETGTDVEGAASARMAFRENLWAGLEGRYRAEVESEALPPPGRRFDLIAGPVMGGSIGTVRLQGLVGLGMPLGTAPAGVAGQATLSVDF